MALTLDDLKELDATEMQERPVLPKGKYQVELGNLVAREKQSKMTGDTYIEVSCALTPISNDVDPDDLFAAADEWGGSVEDMIAGAQVWFRKQLFDAQNVKDLHKMLVKATGRDDLPGDVKGLGRATKGLTAFALVDVEVYDGVRRNSDVRKLIAE